MLVVQNSSFDKPTFIQKLMQRKLSTKHNIRPLWNEKDTHITSYYFTTKKAKTYNQPKLSHSKSQSEMCCPSKKTPSLTSSSSSTSSADSYALPKQSVKNQKKRPLSSESILQMMDKRILQKQYEQQQQQHDQGDQLCRSASGPVGHGLQQQRFDRVLPKPAKKRGSTKRKRSGSKASIITECANVLSQNEEEQDRMVEQNYLLRTAFGSDFSCPIQSQLEKGIVVLDVGCGPGAWTMEMSTAFPNSTFIGMDQSPVFPKFIKPLNCHFRTCDSLVSLPFPDNSIDYIYQRDMNWAFQSQTWQPLIQEFNRILKPGGWMEFVEPNLEAQNDLEKQRYLNDKLITGLCLRQQDPYAVHRLPTTLSKNGLEQVETITQSFRLGWVASQNTDPQEKLKSSKVSRAMSSQYTNLLKSLKPWLSSVMNLSHAEYDDYIADMPAEWRQAKTYINWHCIIAQKPLFI
ncbi:unnamed protein product [Rhizopus stolonifer]